MDIKRKVQSRGSQGNAASDYSDIIARACDWQYGRAVHSNDIEDESQEEDLAFGVPHETMDFDPPGMIDRAKKAASDVAKNVQQKVQDVKTAYRSGMQQTGQLGPELKTAREMADIGRQATADVLPKDK